MTASIMDVEEELPKQLEKLSITPFRMQNKSHEETNSSNYNKFVAVKAEDSNPSANRTLTHFTHKIRPFGFRRCRFRRNSESTLDEIKMPKVHTSKCLIQSPNLGCNLFSGTLKHAIKNSHGTVNRRVILREPILKALQTCLNPHSEFYKQFILSKNNKTLMFDAVEVDVPTCQGLIVKCHNLLTENVDFNRRLNLLNSNRRMEKKCIQFKELSENEDTCKKQSKALVSNQKQNEKNRIDVTVSESHVDQADRLGSLSSFNMGYALCSQQGNSNSTSTTVCDDITIDELASYFDTFVYIPKKMSSMAEMMYI